MFPLRGYTPPILGSDFLGHYDILIDYKRKALIPTPHLHLAHHPDLSNSRALASVEIESEFNYLFGALPTVAEASHPVSHRIQCGKQVVSSRPYRIPIAQVVTVKPIFDKVLADGIIRPSDSPFASP